MNSDLQDDVVPIDRVTVSWQPSVVSVNWNRYVLNILPNYLSHFSSSQVVIGSMKFDTHPVWWRYLGKAVILDLNISIYAGQDGVVCFKCKQSGPYARECPNAGWAEVLSPRRHIKLLCKRIDEFWQTRNDRRKLSVVIVQKWHRETLSKRKSKTICTFYGNSAIFPEAAFRVCGATVVSWKRSFVEQVLCND